MHVHCFSSKTFLQNSCFYIKWRQVNGDEFWYQEFELTGGSFPLHGYLKMNFLALFHLITAENASYIRWVYSLLPTLITPQLFLSLFFHPRNPQQLSACFSQGHICSSYCVKPSFSVKSLSSFQPKISLGTSPFQRANALPKSFCRASFSSWMLCSDVKIKCTTLNRDKPNLLHIMP